MILDEVEQLLHERIGLDAGTVGVSGLNYALKQRMAACAITDPSLYWRRLTATPQEQQELINAVIVPETWFFRDPKAFVAMTRQALAMRATGKVAEGRALRLISLPCSTGEEPYSMAMALFDAGLGASDFAIDAIDISTRNLAAAAQAVYGRNSFRGTDLEFRARHFNAVEGGYRPHAEIRRQVRFRHGNLLDALGIDAEPYDVVFCRNLLIYFDRDTQERALDRLSRMLAPHGVLLVGSGEAGLPLQCGFSSLRIPMAFAFAKRDAAERQPKPAASPPAPAGRKPPARPAPAASLRTRMPPPRAAVAPAPPQSPSPAVAPAPSRDAAGESLGIVERAANEGRLGEARQAARRHIEAFGPSAAALYLLGLACDADGAADEAVEAYRKVLYLAPDHREALAHLALLLRQRGDLAGAKAFSDRLGRLEKRSDRQ
ncbi:chemotaxis protein methyltransferase WspC [Ancylobacter sp. 3268]|uniref:CheR family methyltransferase n=1 Tax=Ancylobacter sp. 3268 TaxID=2817752 RepID=UPI002867A4B9|nr:protein-glutamate O-methyltransferase CheR [Ancylobacter sp. 3268]MDR6953938.1 chemotaxis protein methyltransferase WspC [Ancylobacter sp. 3268]